MYSVTNYHKSDFDKVCLTDNLCVSDGVHISLHLPENPGYAAVTGWGDVDRTCGVGNGEDVCARAAL